MHWFYSLYLPFLALAALAFSALSVYAWRRRSKPGAFTFVFLTALVGLTVVTYALELTSDTLQQKQLFARFQYFGYTSLPVLSLCVVLEVSGLERWCRGRRLLALCLVPALTMALVWTNDLHELIWVDARLGNGTPFSFIDKGYGAWFWVHAAYSYLVVLLALIVLAAGAIRTKGARRRQSLMLLAAAFPPLLASVAYVLHISPMPNIDTSPIVFGVSALFIGRALLHDHLFDIVPIAQSQVIAEMTDGFIVLDTHGNVVDCNHAAANLLGKPRTELVGGDGEAALGEWPSLLALGRSCLSDAVELVFGTGPDRRFVEARASVLHDRKGRTVGVVMALRDVSARVSAEQALRESEERFRRLAENAEDIIFRYDLQPSRHLAYISPAFERITGYSVEQVYAHPDFVYTIVQTKDRAQVVSAVANEEYGKVVEVAISHRDGRTVCLEVKATPVCDANGEVVSIEGIARDVTERRLAAEKVRQANDRLVKWVAELGERNREAALLNQLAGLLLGCLTLEEAYSVVGQMAQKMFPGDSGQLVILDPLTSRLAIAARWGDGDGVDKTMPSDSCWALRRRMLHLVDRWHVGPACHHAGELVACDRLCVPMLARGDPVGVLHLRLGTNPDRARGLEEARRLAVTVAETTALALVNLRLRSALREQAIRDPLTGLFNRRYMEETLNHELARAQRHGEPLSLLMLDVDRFKATNDDVGHEAGDAVLCALGRYLRTHLRAEDVACRLGGDEFVLLMPDAALADVVARAEELRQGIAGLTVEVDVCGVRPVTVSIGVAAFPEHGQSADQLLRAADIALYRAKAEGRNRVVVAAPGRDRRGLRLVQDLAARVDAGPLPPATT